jgi:hypothetical protein
VSDIVITLKIPEELANNAQQYGLLSNERIIALLQAEVARSVAVTGDEPAADDGTRAASLRYMQDAAAKLRALEPSMTLEEIEEGIRSARNAK